MHARGRLLVLGLIALPLVWAWRGGGGLFPTEREVIWDVAIPSSSVSAIEVQLWDGTALVARQWRSLGEGQAPTPWTQRVFLAEGIYQAKVVVEGPREALATNVPVVVRGERAIHVSARLE